MKKLLLLTALVGLVIGAEAQSFQARSFINPTIASITVSNAASGALGYVTNVLSTGAMGTNSLNLTWTNAAGTWVIVTNGVPATATSAISFVTNDSTALLVDVPLYSDRNGAGFAQVTNTATLSALSPLNVMFKVSGASGSTGANINFVFVGVPDGVNEVTTGTVGSGSPTWTVGITPNTTSTVVVYTNVPMASFVGCKALRLQTIKSAITSAANIGTTVQAVSLNGFVP